MTQETQQDKPGHHRHRRGRPGGAPGMAMMTNTPVAERDDSLDAQPLLAFIEARGGVIEFFPFHEVDTNDPSARRDSATRAVHPEDRRSYNAVLTGLKRARQRGRILPTSVDAICVRLRLHPAEIYGDDWYDLEEA